MKVKSKDVPVITTSREMFYSYNDGEEGGVWATVRSCELTQMFRPGEIYIDDTEASRAVNGGGWGSQALGRIRFSAPRPGEQYLREGNLSRVQSAGSGVAAGQSRGSLPLRRRNALAESGGCHLGFGCVESQVEGRVRSMDTCCASIFLWQKQFSFLTSLVTLAEQLLNITF